MIDNWIGGVSIKKRKVFIDEIFDAMAASGTTTFYKLRQHLEYRVLKKTL